MPDDQLDRLKDRLRQLEQRPAPRHGQHGKHGRDGVNGKDGRPGEPGVPGPIGRTGAQGVEGKEGPQGTRGEVGPQGERGEKGIDGGQGLPGIPGAQGKDGAVGPAGPQGPKGAQGPIGPMPAHRWDGTELQFQQAPDGAWGERVDLQGPPGKAGRNAGGGGFGGGAAQGGGGVAISAGASSASSGTVSFQDGNGVSFGLVGNVMTASVGVAGAGLTNIKINAGTTSNFLSNFEFVDANGVSFGLNGSTITASVATNYLTTAMQSNAATSFANGNGVTFGLAGSTITASVQTNYLTTAMASNAATISNIKASAGTQSSNLSALTFGDANGVSFGLDNGTITASISPAGGGLTNINFSAGTTSQNLSKLTFADGGGVSFGLNGSVVTATVATNYLTTAMASNAATISNINVSAGTTSRNLSNVVYADSNGVSFGLNGSTITATVKTDYLTTAMQSASSSNFAGTGFTTTTIAGAVVAGTHDTNGLKLAVPAYLTTAMQSASSSNFAATGFTTTTVAGAVIAGTHDTAGLKLAVPAYLTTGMASNAATISNVNISAGTTSNNLSALTFGNANGVSFGLNASTITGSVAAQTAQTIGIYASSQTTGQSSSSTVDARSLTVVGMGNISAGMSAGSLVISGSGGGGGSINVSAGTTSNNLTNITFFNSNGVSFGLNGSTLTASIAAGNFTGSWYALGNTTQNTSSALASYSLNGLGAMTVGFSNGSIQLSAPASSSIVATSGLSISTNGSTISVIGQSFVGTSGISISTNGGTITVQGPGNFATLSQVEVNYGGSALLSMGNATMHVQPFVVPQYASFNRLVHAVSLNAAATASHSSQSTRSNQWSMGRSYALYSQGTGTNSTQLELVYSNTVSLSGAVAYGHSSNGASATASHVVQFAGLSQIDSAGGVTYTTISGTSSSSTGANSSVSIANTFTGAMTGAKLLIVPFASSLTPGNYWMAHMARSSSTSQASNSTVMSMSNFMQSTGSVFYQPMMSAATVSSTAHAMGHGVYSASASSFPTAIPFNQIVQVYTQYQQPFMLQNMTQ